MQLIFAKTISECPVCESTAVRRSRRKGYIERICLRLAFVWPYRCKSCDSRFWGFHRAYPVSRLNSGFDLVRDQVRSGALHS